MHPGVTTPDGVGTFRAAQKGVKSRGVVYDVVA